MFWSMLILVATADACCEKASRPRLEAQEPQVRHRIQLPTAPYPARRNPAFQARRAHFELPPPQDSEKTKGNEDLFGQDPPLGPYPPLSDLKGYNLPPPQIPKYEGQEFPKEESLEYLTPRGQGILDGLALISHALEPNRPRVQNGLYPLGFQQNQGQQPLNPWYGLPVPTQPSYPPRLQSGFRPWNPGYGQTVPTAMGPYSQRRLKPMQFFPVTQVQTQLAPLRDIESSTKSNKPFDSWLGAKGRGRSQPPSLEQFGPLVPPQLRPSGRNPTQAQVTSDYSEEGAPPVPGEKGYVRPVTRKTFVMHGLLRHLTETTTQSPPPLLRDEDGLMEEFVPESDDRSIFSEERKQLPKLPPDVPNAFDNIFT